MPVPHPPEWLAPAWVQLVRTATGLLSAGDAGAAADLVLQFLCSTRARKAKAEGLTILGDCSLASDDLRGALRYWSRAARLCPPGSFAKYVSIGCHMVPALLGRGDHRSALIWCRRALEVCVESTDVCADGILSQMLSLQPWRRQDLLLVSRAVVHSYRLFGALPANELGIGDRIGALRDFMIGEGPLQEGMVRSPIPEWLQPRWRRVQTDSAQLLDSGDPEGAIEAIAPLLPLVRSKHLRAHLLAKLGDCHFATGFVQRAMRHWRQAAAIGPPGSELRYGVIVRHIVPALLDSADRAAARRWARNALRTCLDSAEICGVKAIEQMQRMELLSEQDGALVKRTIAHSFGIYGMAPPRRMRPVDQAEVLRGLAGASH